MLQKINISFLKKKSNVFDNKEEDMSDESDYTKNFEAIFKNMKVSKKSTESISVKSRGKNINLHPLIIKLLNAKKKKKKRCSKKIMNLMKYLIFLIKLMLIAISLPSINL